MRNIVLIGMPGSGKTTFGQKLAEALHRPFVDADDYLEERSGRSIRDLFAESEDAFRRTEEKIVRELSEREGIVIATGGGVIKRAVNMEHLRENGLVLFLDRSPSDIASDVEVEKRPLLKDGPQKVYTLYEERIGLYRRYAHRCIPNRGTEAEVLENILKVLAEDMK